MVGLAVLMCSGVVALSPSAALADKGGREKNVKTSVRIAFTGPAIGGVKPSGHAQFEIEGTRRKLEVEVEKFNLADGTVVSVQINGNLVGMIKLVARHGELELESKNGAAVPAIQKGDIVTVTSPTGDVLLSGTF